MLKVLYEDIIITTFLRFINQPLDSENTYSILYSI